MYQNNASRGLSSQGRGYYIPTGVACPGYTCARAAGLPGPEGIINGGGYYKLQVKGG
jgi:hypothetical protein